MLLIAIGVALCGCPTQPYGGGGDDDDDGDNGALSVAAEGVSISNGGTYCTPMNTCTNTVPLFAEQRTMMTIRNTSGGDLTIHSVSAQHHSGNEVEEWTLIDTELVPSPLSVDGTVLADDEAIDFYPRFYPVQSGERGCTVTIEHDEGAFTFDVTGLGAYDAYFFSEGDTSTHKLLGGTDSDELAGGMVADGAGNVVFTANVSEVIDSFTPDILVAGADSSGGLSWAKIWNGSYRDTSTDPGQNSESGGGADSIAIDDEGYVYVVGATSPTNANSTFWSLILKIDSVDGSLVWEKVWSPRGQVSIASDSSQFYGVDVADGKVYATGTAIGEAEVSLVVFDAADGSVLSQSTFDPNPTYNDRGYTVRVDGNKAFVGGNGAGGAFLAKLNGANGANPTIAWCKELGLGTGGNINSMDLDADGNVYAAMDVRGASMIFSLARFSPGGSMEWSRAYAASANDNNNIHVVREADGVVYAGGRIGLDWYDAQMGDGMILALNANTGNETWSGFYFNGTGPADISEHRIKGMALAGSQMHLLTQVYTGTGNGERYWGYWYDGTGETADLTVDTSEVSCSVTAASDGEAFDAAPYRNGWTDAPASVVWQDADAKSDGYPPDADVMWMKVGM